MSPKRFFLRYLNDSVAHREEYGSELGAIGRAIALRQAGVAYDFSIHDENGRLLRSDADIARLAKRL